MVSRVSPVLIPMKPVLLQGTELPSQVRGLPSRLAQAMVPVTVPTRDGTINGVITWMVPGGDGRSGCLRSHCHTAR